MSRRNLKIKASLRWAPSAQRGESGLNSPSGQPGLTGDARVALVALARLLARQAARDCDPKRPTASLGFSS